MELTSSILNMAEAMLNDEYRLSHDSLTGIVREEMNRVEQNAAQQQEQAEKEGQEEPHHFQATGFSQHQQRQQQQMSKESGHESSRNANPSRAPKRTDSRSVVIQEPPKRRKLTSSLAVSRTDPKEIVNALYTSMTMEDQNDAIEAACISFEHHDANLHKEEIEAGADIALVKQLAFLEFRTGFRRPPIQADLVAITKQIANVCHALELVLRAPSESVAMAFDRVGTDLLQILVILIDEEVKRRTNQAQSPKSPTCVSSVQSAVPSNDIAEKEDPEMDPDTSAAQDIVESQWEHDLLLRKTTKILGHLARVGRATYDIAHFPGLLGSVLNLINLRPYEAIPWEARLSCLWTLANLACNTDNMMMMICTPGLINSLVHVGYRQINVQDPLEQTMEVLRARSIACRALLNLSWPPENKIVMADNMAMISVLCQLAVERTSPYSKSRTIQEVLCQTRRHAVGALRNLAAAPRRSKINLCSYSNGMLLDTLTDVALADNDDKTTELAFAAIHNLAVHDTAEQMVSKPDLVLALKTRLLDEEDERKKNRESSEDKSSGTRSHAASTILVLERSITREMSASYDTLQELLYATTPSRTNPETSAPTPPLTSEHSNSSRPDTPRDGGMGGDRNDEMQHIIQV